MKIEIKNYKNINNLKLNIDDKKINFVFGISGSGKSSVGEAINRINVSRNATIGKKEEDVIIKINDIPNFRRKIGVFNSEIMEKLFIETDNSEVYRIIFDRDSKLEKLILKYDEEVSKINFYKEEMYRALNNIDNLSKNYGGKLKNNKTELPASSKLIKLQDAIENTNNIKLVTKLKQRGNNYINWIQEGANSKLYSKNICPFCEQKIKAKILDKINELINLNSSDFKLLSLKSPELKELKIKVPDYTNLKQIESFKNDIIEHILLSEEIRNVINILEYCNDNIASPSNITEIELSKLFGLKFPEVYAVIINLNKKIKDIKKILGNVKSETDSIIKKNQKQINLYLEKFGIPYIFNVDNYSLKKHNLGYSLYHRDDDTKVNRREGLSYGEKNIIGLLLFLLSTNDSVIIIDDPASSFDDFRRKIIYDVIFEQVLNKTVLVLSHDQVFIKYAVFNFENSKKKKISLSVTEKNYLKYTGKIINFENYAKGEVITKKISYKDFDDLSHHILENINNKMEYYRLIINLRLYYELRKTRDSLNHIIWEYLSAIYHLNAKSEIDKQLNIRNIEEKKILNQIFNDTKIRLGSVPMNDYSKIDTTNITEFERVLYYREIKDGKNRILKCDFDNVVHVNEALKVCLNPFKFNYFSPYIYDYIINKESEVRNND